ncbi:MAG: hypothetical protein Fur0020_02280 [Thermodesulfovibrionia bacterium]
MEDSDLELFFREIEKIANGNITEDLLKTAKQELINEFESHRRFEFEELDCVVNTDLISRLDYKVFL